MIMQAKAMMAQRSIQACASGQVFGPQPIVMMASSPGTIQQAGVPDYGYDMHQYK